MTKTPEEIFTIEYWQKHPVTYSEVIEAMEIFAESSTKELQSEITQLKEVLTHLCHNARVIKSVSDSGENSLLTDWYNKALTKINT